jgi:hypothetical protein
VQELGGRVEERLEGWLEEPPWEESLREETPWPPGERERGRDDRRGREEADGPDPLEDWSEEPLEPRQPPPAEPAPRRGRRREPEPEGPDDPWI